MKAFTIRIYFIALIALLFAGACKKDNIVYDKDLVSFVFEADKNVGLPADIKGEIVGDTIYARIPNTVDVTQLVASFERSNPRTIIKVKGTVQESGVSPVDYTEGGIQFEIKAEDRGVRKYTVKLERHAVFIKFGFYKEDNPAFLTRDYIGKVQGLNVNVPVSRNVDLSQLAARFETIDGREVKVAGVIQESRTSRNNFSASASESDNKVVYEITDPTVSEPQRFTVNITDITEPEWTMIGDNISQSGAAGIKMAINPVTGLPAIAYYRSGKDENGNAISTADRKLAVVALTPAGWAFLGNPKGITEYKADNIAIAFDNGGVPYTACKESTDSEQKATVMKYTGGAWQLLGAARFTTFKPAYMSIAIDEANVPYISMIKDGANPEPGIANRTVLIMNYKDAQWSFAPNPGILGFYTQLVKANGKIYLGVMDRSTNANKPSLFSLGGSSWNAVGPTSFSVNSNPGFQVVSPAIASDGTAYVAYQESVSGKRVDHVMKLDGGLWKEVGQGVPVLGTSDNFALAVHPDGTLFFAWVQPQVEAMSAGLYVKSFNKDLNTWNKPRLLLSGSVGSFDMQISADGVPYVAALNKDGNVSAFKFALP